ncbi:MAG TPA: hypothetical protein VMB71_15720, partial [Acetobacteraceae bacterium]|nr:hypothetical protein [Acetobacteraceae bacterium]
MPLAHPVALVLATAFIATSTWRGRLHPFLAVLAAAAAFALLTGMSISQFGKTFGNGFGETVDNLGLPVLAAAMIAALAEPIVPFALARLPLIPGLCGLGLVAGTAASAGGAFAVLTPLRTRMAGRAPRRAALTLGLAISAGQAALLPSPVLIAATAILAAPWTRVVMFGLPLALVGATLGAALAALAARTWPQAQDAPPAPTPVGTRTIAVAAGCLAMLALLIIQSVGYMPTEPWGGGSSRELILGVGRPVFLLCVGV